MSDSRWSAVNEEAGQRMIKTNGVDLCTQAFGDPANPALLLIMGADPLRCCAGPRLVPAAGGLWPVCHPLGKVALHGFAVERFQSPRASAKPGSTTLKWRQGPAVPRRRVRVLPDPSGVRYAPGGF